VSGSTGTAVLRVRQRRDHLRWRGLRSIAPSALAIAFVLLVDVVTIQIAPTVDLPETVLHEHHVASHSARSHTTGNLIVPGTNGSLQTYFKNNPLPVIETARFSEREHGQQFLVLRC
jgi:hypothetical protein